MRKPKNTLTQQFIKDKEKAVLTLNVNIIKDFYDKYDIDAPSTEFSFWKQVYIMCLSVPHCPSEIKNEAYLWFKENEVRL